MKNSKFQTLTQAFGALLATVFLVGGCAHQAATEQISGPNKAEESRSASWNNDFISSNSECDKILLCVSGEGETSIEAERHARLEAAKFFETKVSATTQISSSSEQKVNQAIGDYAEWVSKSISEETNEMINGLEMKKQNQINGRYYVLMSLDREKSAEILREKIISMDKENEHLLAAGTRYAFPRILRNLSLAEPLLTRHTLLTARPLKPVVSKAVLVESINKLTPIKMAIVTKGAGLPAQLNHTLNQMIAPIKIIVVGKNEGAQNTLVCELIAEELYFKVEGFKRYNIILKLELQNMKGEILGRLSASSEQTTRSKEQAMQAALPILKDSLLENFNQLSQVNNQTVNN